MVERMEISKHAIEQYACRFKPKISANISDAFKSTIIANMLRLAFVNAVYVKDNEEGILFRNYELKADIIVKNNTIITIFPLKLPLKQVRYNKPNKQHRLEKELEPQ